MIVYDGTYQLQPDAGRGSRPRPKWVCAWRVRIIEQTGDQPTVQHLKPTIVVAKPSGLPTSLTSCAEAVGKKISRDFKLEVQRVLWIEQIPSNPGQWQAAVFTPRALVGPNANYDISWRPLRPNEEGLIKRFGISTP